TQNLNQTLAAQNASLTVNGIAITSASNTVSGAIQGVALTLKNTTATAASLTVTRDTAAISTAASGFVDAYNALASQIKSRSAYGSTGSAGGVLAGDSALRAMQDQLRSIFITPATGGTLSSLSQVGITTKADGSLALDSSALNSAIAADYNDVVNLFSSPSGFATRMDAWATTALSAGGLIESRTESLKSFVKDRSAEVDRLENRMLALQKKYTAEYTNLNLMLSRMNSTSTFLTQQLLSQPSRN
ncbi:MAG: flagellar filament capping protein FliD, partial [Thiobacillus sp.]|nr:flagellar filament capping protein FliD [Thiobacillus sp.]